MLDSLAAARVFQAFAPKKTYARVCAYYRLTQREELRPSDRRAHEFRRSRLAESHLAGPAARAAGEWWVARRLACIFFDIGVTCILLWLAPLRTERLGKTN